MPLTTRVHLSVFVFHVYLVLSASNKNQQESSSQENRCIQLSEIPTEILLSSESLTLKELQIPREKLSLGSLQIVKHGRNWSIYRAKLETENSGKTKSVILKALQGKAHGGESSLVQISVSKA